MDWVYRCRAIHCAWHRGRWHYRRLHRQLIGAYVGTHTVASTLLGNEVRGRWCTMVNGLISMMTSRAICGRSDVLLDKVAHGWMMHSVTSHILISQGARPRIHNRTSAWTGTVLDCWSQKWVKLLIHLRLHILLFRRRAEALDQTSNLVPCHRVSVLESKERCRVQRHKQLRDSCRVICLRCPSSGEERRHRR